MNSCELFCTWQATVTLNMTVVIHFTSDGLGLPVYFASINRRWGLLCLSQAHSQSGGCLSKMTAALAFTGNGTPC